MRPLSIDELEIVAGGRAGWDSTDYNSAMGGMDIDHAAMAEQTARSMANSLWLQGQSTPSVTVMDPSSEQDPVNLGDGQWMYSHGDGNYSIGTDSNSDGFLETTTYYYADGSSYFTTDPYGEGVGYAYFGGQAGAYGAVAGVYQVIDGDTFVSIGVGTPGVAGEVGYSASGDLSGFNANWGAPVGPGQVTGNVTGDAIGYSLGSGPLGSFSGSVTYTFNANNAYNNTVGYVDYLSGAAAAALIDNFYPAPYGNSPGSGGFNEMPRTQIQ